MDSEREKRIAAKGRHAALVIAGAMLTWLALQILGRDLGLPGRYAFLFDFAVIGALLYAVFNIFQLWRMRRDTKGQ